ncbi:MAG: S46 family peptidase [Bacteroidota bacterium]
MKKIILSFLVLSFMFKINSKADEGMWLPLLIKRLNYADMQKLGCKLTPEEIYSVNNSSLKDAIVQFGGGCTGEVISPEGLILTNHHCGIGQVQSHSSVENDYLNNGFWAMSKDAELPNPGLTVSFLIRMEDVSEAINAELKDQMTETERKTIISKISKKLEEDAIAETHYRAEIESFFGGNEFYLFVYEVFEDVRLVGVPPWGIGKFGADTDNWMWPRHKGDFCLFRVYTDKEGKPASYSPENIPLKPKHHLPVSIKGVKKGDFAMILGYPGSTDRYMTSYGVKMIIDKTAPSIIEIRSKKLEIMREDMDADKSVFIKYANKQASVSNYWKYFIGQKEQLINNKVYERKLELENQFTAWIDGEPERKTKYGNVLNSIGKAYEELSAYEVARCYFNDGIRRGSEIIALSSVFRKLNSAIKKEGKVTDELKKELTDYTINHFKNYNLPTDKKIFAAMMEMYYNNVPVEQQPAYFRSLVEKNKNNYTKLTETLFAKTVFSDQHRIMALLESPKLIETDPVYMFMMSFLESYWDLDEKVSQAKSDLRHGERLFISGLREMQPDKTFYPDANFTMRLTYGTVQDYYPADAVHYDYITTLNGVMEKEVPGDWEFNVPEKLKNLYEKKDFGEYGENGTMVVDFITNNDITGGNSGSPVIDGEGNLIGLAFDGNWEAMSGDVEFEPEFQRTINVDARYLLFIIDKYAGASNLIDEITIVR